MPKTMKVGPHVYTVLRKPKSQMSNEDLGGCDFNTLQISVQQRLRKSKAREILLHELLHACTYPSLSSGDKYTDEQFVETTAPILLQVIQENPELIAYLTQ